MNWVRWAVAAGLLAWLAGPYWPQSVDDVYIALAYAHEWLESGELRWTTGERVEGYSNFLWVALLRVAVGAGLDGAVAAKLLGLTCAAALLAYASRKLPDTPQGTAALLAMAAWAPLARWGVDGMETTLYALLLTVGWVQACAGRWSVGTALLALASLTRPEGAAWVGGAVVVRALARRRPGPDDLGGVVAIGALGLYHALRVSWFGAFLPTPILLKILPVPLTTYGWFQAAGELVTAAGLVIGAGLASGTRGRMAILALAPLLFQCLVLGRASGDWMAGARLLLPGVVATTVAWSALGEGRRPSWLAGAVILAVAVVAGRWIPVGYGEARVEARKLPSFAAPAYAAGLDTPLSEDIAWVVEQVPEGDTIFVPDVGMLGNVPGVQVKDQRGLVQRAIAVAIAGGPRSEEAGIRAYVTGPDAPSFLRVAAWNNGTPPELPDWMAERYALRDELRYGGGTIRWYARHDRRPTEETVLRRWEVLVQRYPSHPFLAWRQALALADAGRWTEARERGAAAQARWPQTPALQDLPRSLSFPEPPHPFDWVDGRGRALYWNWAVRSRPLSVGTLPTLHLDADHPGAEGALAEIVTEADCGTRAETKAVFGPVEVPIPLPECATAGGVRVTVRFTNDDATGGDRNLYVSLNEEAGSR